MCLRSLHQTSQLILTRQVTLERVLIPLKKVLLLIIHVSELISIPLTRQLIHMKILKIPMLDIPQDLTGQS